MTRAHRSVAFLLASAAICLLASGDLRAQLRKNKALRPDTKSCLDCHRKEASVFDAKRSRHAPVAAGNCQSCHLKHGVVGVNRLAAEDPQLCLACHAMEGAPESGKGVGAKGKESGAAARTHLFSHPPGESLKCGTCHDPHGSDRPHLLEAEGAATCVTCHKPESFHGASTHTAATVDCLSCHDPHGSKIGANLSKDAAALCVTCHDGKSEPERRGHGDRSPAPATCLSCHTPHASAAKGLMRRNVHAPMAETPGGCESCHAKGSGEGQTVALVSPVPELCMTCHEDPRTIPAKGVDGHRVHPPAAEGDCIACHTPHASDEKGLLRTTQQELCGTCHADVKQQTARSNVHPPAAEGDCLTCHDPHGSGQQGNLKQPAAALCTTCHDGMKTELEARVQHPPAKQGACISCHEPHGSSAEHLVVADLGKACLKCHEQKALVSSSEHLHPPFADADCLACHKPHSSSREGLLITESGVLCRSCHEDLVGEKSSRTRHAPVTRGQCLACHDPHGGHSEALLRRAETKAICLSCHVEQGRMMVRQDLTVHPPFKKDSCLTCHGAHASAEDGLLAMSPAALCATCHDLTKPSMTAPHKGLITSTTDCSGCHEPHASENKKLLLADQHPPFGQGDCSACHQGGRK